MKRDLQLIYFNAGGGHRSAAIALQEVMARSHPDWTVTLINLFDVIDPEHYYQKLTGFEPEDIYNLRLKKRLDQRSGHRTQDFSSLDSAHPAKAQK
jgi:hypothetical protein